MSHLTRKQFDDYQKSLLQYSEVKSVGDTAFEEGKAEDIEEGKTVKTLEIAKTLLAKGFDKNSVSEISSLSLDTIANL